MRKLLTVWLAAAALGFSVASPGVFAQETPVAPATEATATAKMLCRKKMNCSFPKWLFCVVPVELVFIKLLVQDY